MRRKRKSVTSSKPVAAAETHVVNRDVYTHIATAVAFVAVFATALVANAIVSSTV